MRSEKAILNIGFSLVLQMVMLVCGLIMPRLIIKTYGSLTNGLIISATQFLGYIILLDAGVGGVARAVLYKPLSDWDIPRISSILLSLEKFFRKISCVFLLYLVFISMFFSNFGGGYFDFLYASTLVLILGANTFSQYYFGITFQCLLQADQRQYVNALIQIIITILNTVVTVLLIHYGVGIHLVKLASTLIFLMRPILLNLYIKRKYCLIKNAEEDPTCLRQKRDALGQHIAYFLHINTDVIILTLFTTFKEVSIYSIYFMIINMINTLVSTFSNGFSGAYGNMLAKGEQETLRRTFFLHQFIVHTLVTILFTATSILLLPFVKLYTHDLLDANYIQPLFGMVLILAEAMSCIRAPYNDIILAAGHFKETKRGAYGEAAMNFAISIVLVKSFGLIGVAIGTLCAMLFRTVYLVHYLSHALLYVPVVRFVKCCTASLISVLFVVILKSYIPNDITTYIDWILYAVIITTLAATITIAINSIAYQKESKLLIAYILKIFKKK